MAIRAGQIVHDAQGFVIDRIQTGGATNLNIPQERVHELGNYQAVATVRDIPDLQFEIQSLDVSTEVEALLVGRNPTFVNTGDGISFDNSVPLHIISPFRSGNGAFNIVKGIVVPSLYLDTVVYRFGVKANAQETFTLRGDSIYYVPGSPYYQTYGVLAGANQSYTLPNTAISYTEGANTIYALGVCAVNPSTHTYKKLFIGTNYTNTSTSVSVIDNLSAQGFTELHVVYGSTTAATYDTTKQEGASVKPAAVRSKDICVYVQDPRQATPSLVKWGGVQTVDVTRKVTLDNIEEFCNSHYIDMTWNAADVNGTIAVKSVDTTDLFDKISQVANVSTSSIVGPLTSTPLQTEIRINDPNTGVRLKTINIPDARFEAPPYSGRANQNLDVTFKWSSDSGSMTVYKGAGPNG